MINYDESAGSRVPLEVADHIAVQRLVHRYADAVVHRDAEQWGSCWADDAEWDLGRGRRVAGRQAIVDLWQSAMAGMAAVVQNVLNGDAWVDEGAVDRADPPTAPRARGRWYINERFRRSNGVNSILLAHYDDDYVCTDGRWLFTNRVLRVHYLGAPDLTADFTNTDEALRARAADA